MQWIFAYVINFFIGVLESSFSSSTSSNSNLDDDDTTTKTNNTDSNNIFNPDETNQSKALEEAYEFFELKKEKDLRSRICDGKDANLDLKNLDELEIRVKKQYKKLSLRYHPDRNGNSEESIQQMQKLNACLAIIEQDITNTRRRQRQRQQKQTGNDEVDIDDDLHDDEEEEEYDPYKIYEEMQKEMREELKRYEKLRREFNKTKKKEQTKCHVAQQREQLYTSDGRREAYEAFVQQVAQRRHRQEEDDDETTPSTSDGGDDDDASADDTPPTQPAKSSTKKSKSATKKPKYFVMEYNGDELIVAMRLNVQDIALTLFEERINAYIQTRVCNSRISGEYVTMNSLTVEFLLKPMDFDNNTILHYAIYCEMYQMVNIICSLALKFQGLDKVLYQRNVYGQCPCDSIFLDTCSDESIKTLLEYQRKLSDGMQSKTKLVPAMKDACSRFGRLLLHLNFITTFNTILSFWMIGVTIMKLHPIISILGVAFMQYNSKRCKEDDDSEEVTEEHIAAIADVTILWSFFLTWKIVHVGFILLTRYVMIELILILSPFAIAVFVSKSRNGALAGLIEFVLFPLMIQAYVARYLERALVSCHTITTPTFIIRRGGGQQVLKAHLLILTSFIAWGIVSRKY